MFLNEAQYFSWIFTENRMFNKNLDFLWFFFYFFLIRIDTDWVWNKGHVI